MGDDIRKVRSIDAITHLVRGGVKLVLAKRSIEAAIDGEKLVLDVPRVPNAIALEQKLLESGFVASVEVHAEPETADTRAPPQ